MRAGGASRSGARGEAGGASAGADGITAHLREDRRHISDDDIARLPREMKMPLNLEMAATTKCWRSRSRHKPHAACIVPEKREERTTEGGIDAAGQHNRLAADRRQLARGHPRLAVHRARQRQLDAPSLGAPVVELHTGAYCQRGGGASRAKLLAAIRGCARYGADPWA
jgi:pyridoxine 5-phosphate synthase